ncbi:MAG: hypothetical protein WAV46_01115 [Candidatus Moraniibacteriota bacterium]
MAIRAYQDAFVYFSLNPFPTSGEPILRNPEIFPAICVMKFERILTLLIATNGTFSAFVLDSFFANSLTPLRNSAFQVLSTISIGSFVWHTL